MRLGLTKPKRIDFRTKNAAMRQIFLEEMIDKSDFLCTFAREFRK
jgi:hypothetical protein